VNGEATPADWQRDCANFLFYGTFVLDPTGQMGENIIIERCMRRGGQPGAFFLARMPVSPPAIVPLEYGTRPGIRSVGPHSDRRDLKNFAIASQLAEARRSDRSDDQIGL